MVPAALNRETSFLIPIIVAAHAILFRSSPSQLRSALWAAGAGLAIYTAITVGLRLYYGTQQFLTADGYYPGLSLLALNLRRAETWEQLLVTFGIIPLLAVAAYGRWPRSLRLFFWVVTPVWIAIHLVAALIAETRLLLVPYALAVVPAALFSLIAPDPGTEGLEGTTA
jgi:hypothetical protein